MPMLAAYRDPFCFPKIEIKLKPNGENHYKSIMLLNHGILEVQDLKCIRCIFRQISESKIAQNSVQTEPEKCMVPSPGVPPRD